jgi:hypothetical protein
MIDPTIIRGWWQEHAAWQLQRLKRIRELCIKALIQATGKSREAIEGAPYSCASERAEEVERLCAEVERLQATLEPFARNVESVSLSEALGHITREHLWEARHALEKK